MFWEEERKLGDSKEETIDNYINGNQLTALLGLPYTLQELWGGNKKLLDYFCRDDVLTEVVKLALCPDVDSTQPSKTRFKLPLACSDILSVRNNNNITNAFLMCDDALDVVKHFFDNNASKHAPVCGFFLKVMQQLFQCSVAKMVETLAPTDFLSKCVQNIRMAAISELLQNIVWVPQVADDFLRIKQWYADCGVCQLLLDQLDPDQPECVHENVMELLTNVIRNVRDQMYALELKTDILNDELQSKDMAIALREKMLMRNERGVISPSLTRNVCEIIVTLLSSNQILNRPSHTLYKEFNSEIPWAGGNPSGDGGNEMMREGADKFCPDPHRIVEMAVAERVADLVQIVIDELEVEDDPVDETWFYLMRVLLELCDTNHVETHAKLVEQFEKCDMKKLFSLVWKQPRYSIFHGMLQRMVSFILYSNTDPLSPAVAYWFETLNLPEIIRFGIEPRCVLKKIDLFSLRTHHIHLALAVEQAMKNSPSSQGVRSAAEKCPTWPIITALVDEWLSWNMPDPEVVNVRPSNQHESIDDAMDEFERAVAPQRHALYEFKSQTVSVQMTDVFDTTLGDLQVSSETKGFNVQGMRFGKIDINLEENDVDESKFEAACGMKKCSLLDSWPMHDGDRSSPFPAFADEWPGEKKSNGSAVDDWPGADSERKTEGSAVFGASSWEDVPASSSSESWASFPLSASTPRKAADDDEWADFSSLKTGNSSVENAGDWPGLEKEEDTNWPETNAAETSNPVLAGLAKGVINSSLGEHGIVDQSEC